MASLNLGLMVRLAIALSVVGGLPVAAQEMEGVDSSETVNRVPETVHLSPATTVEDWVAQIEASLTQITGVRVEETEAGLQLVLETAEGDLPAPTTQTVGNALIADIPNAVLVLPDGNSFEQFAPAEGIALVSVTNEPGDRVRVAITGTDAPPVAEVTATGLSVTLGEVVASTEDDAIQVVVTGEQDEGYRATETSVGTRTDTPLRDIPQAINVVPQQVIQDTQARSITEALENVPGVVAQGTGTTGTRDYFTIRGFENYNNFLVNGLPDPQISSDGIFFNVERIEVLRGPASVLYGQTRFSGLGGTINYVTRQPLSEPFYEVSAAAGNYGFYQGSVDLSGPLNTERTALYRLIGGFRSFDSIVDFNSATTYAVAPSLSLQLGDTTNLLIEGDVNRVSRNGQQPGAQPVLGTVLPNPNGEIPRSFNPIGPVPDNVTYNGRIGYRLEHQFSDNLALRNTFRYVFYLDDDRNIDFSPRDLEVDNRTLEREGIVGEQYYHSYILDTNLLSKFRTGSIEHQLLTGFSLSRDTTDVNFEFGIPAASVDIFNPVYDQMLVTGDRNSSSFTTRDTLGIYLQDQITLSPNLNLLLGASFDFFEERSTNRLSNTDSNQSDTAFNPRVGIVYQPIQPISLYASYARSFAPTIGVAANGELFQPERGTQYEIGVKADLNDRLSATLALYDLTRSNVTTTDPNNPNFSVQTGRQRSRGVEFDIGGEVLPGWNITAGYAYTDARVTEDNSIPVGNRLFNTPEHAVNLWTTYRIQMGSLEGLGFGLGLYYLGDRPLDNANTVELPGFLRTDAAIFYERNQFRAALNIRNLFDVENYVSRYGSSTLVQVGTPFTVQGTLSWRF